MSADRRVPEVFALFVARSASWGKLPIRITETFETPSPAGVSAPVYSAVLAINEGEEKPLAVVALVAPSVAASHSPLLEHVALKARAYRAPYFVTWTMRDTCLWQTPKKGTTVGREHCLKNYFNIFEIGTGADDPLSVPATLKLQQRIDEILGDFVTLHRDGQLQMVDIDATFFVGRLTEAVGRLLGPVQESLALTLQRDPKFRKEVEDWAILQGIPADGGSEDFTASVSRQVIYRLLGKVIFYQSLRRSAKQLPELDLSRVDTSQVLPTLRRSFGKALEIDYHAVFKEDIVDRVPFPSAAAKELATLIGDLNTRNFAYVPQDVMGEVFERLIPREERHNLGQYFTSEELVDLILAFCVRSAEDRVLDPTCGTGTFLIRAYDKLRWMGVHDHLALLSRLWGIDIGPFPAELTTINLFRQRFREGQPEAGNFPRVLCKDFFEVSPDDAFKFPPPKPIGDRPEFIDEPIPLFNAVVGNFPYISQDQIEKRVEGYRDFLMERLIAGWFADYPQLFYYANKKRQATFEAHIVRGTHKGCATDDLEHRISTYADLYVYLFFQAARFLAPGARLGIVTSNAWLDVNYGYELQRFFLSKFRIIAILESRCEPWFEDASVNTVITILERCDDAPSRDDNLVRFVKVKRRLKDLIAEDMKLEAVARWTNLGKLVGKIEAAGKEHFSVTKSGIRCTLRGLDTVEDDNFRIRLRRQGELREEVEAARKTVKWGVYHRAPQSYFDILEACRGRLTIMSEVALPKRGGMTRINEFFHVSTDRVAEFGIEPEYLWPLIKSPKDTQTITVDPTALDLKIFVCRRSKEELKKLGHKGALKYIEWGEKQRWDDGTYWKDGEWVGHRTPGWWSLPESETHFAQVFFSKGYDERHIQRYSPQKLVADQRLYFVEPTQKDDENIVGAVLNSSLVSLFVELTAPMTAGDGICELRVEDARDYLVLPDVRKFSENERKAIVDAFQLLLTRPIESVFEEVKRPDRRALDQAVVAALGLNPKKYLPLIYDGLTTLVSERIELGKMRNKARKSKTKHAIAEVEGVVLGEVLKEMTASFRADTLIAGIPIFPDAFFAGSVLREGYDVVELPAAPLRIEAGTLFSRVIAEGGFVREFPHLASCKYLLYAQRSLSRVEQARSLSVRVPRAMVEITRTVANYESFLRELKSRLFEAYYRRTLDQRTASRLTAAAFDKLHFPVLEEGS